MDTIQILYNTCYGGFKFSDVFAFELGNRIREAVGHSYKHYRYRDHPEAIKLFLEKGSEWSSDSCSKLKIKEIPIYLKDYYDIHEYDGKEYVDINIHRAIADATDTYLENPTAEALEVLKESVHKIKSSCKQWNM